MEAIDKDDARCVPRVVPLPPQRHFGHISVHVDPSFGPGTFPLYVKKTDTVQHFRELVKGKTEIRGGEVEGVLHEVGDGGWEDVVVCEYSEEGFVVGCG